METVHGRKGPLSILLASHFLPRAASHRGMVARFPEKKRKKKIQIRLARAKRNIWSSKSFQLYDEKFLETCGNLIELI